MDQVIVFKRMYLCMVWMQRKPRRLLQHATAIWVSLATIPLWLFPRSSQCLQHNNTGNFLDVNERNKKLLALFFFQPCTLGRNSIKIYMPLCSGRLLPHFATVSMSKSTVWWEIALTDSIRYLKRGKREKIFFLFFLIKCNYSAGNQCHNSRSQVLQIPGTLQHL